MSLISNDLPGFVKPSPALPDDDKLDAVLAYLTESHLDILGGYPFDYREVGSYFVIAELDPGKEYASTMITTYKRSTLLRWYDEAVACFEGEDMINALGETQPDQDA